MTKTFISQQELTQSGRVKIVIARKLFGWLLFSEIHQQVGHSSVGRKLTTGTIIYSNLERQCVK